MFETLAILTCAIVLALAIGAVLAWRSFIKARADLTAALDLGTGTLARLQSMVDHDAKQAEMLAEAIAQLPRKSKPGRKPSTSSTGAKRGRPPKSASTPAPIPPAEPAPPAAPPAAPFVPVLRALGDIARE